MLIQMLIQFIHMFLRLLHLGPETLDPATVSAPTQNPDSQYSLPHIYRLTSPTPAAEYTKPPAPPRDA